MINERVTRIVYSWICCNVYAQPNEYKMEMGGIAKACSYLDNAKNSSLYKNICPLDGVIARYIFDSLKSIKGGYLVCGIKVDTANKIY